MVVGEGAGWSGYCALQVITFVAQFASQWHGGARLVGQGGGGLPQVHGVSEGNRLSGGVVIGGQLTPPPHASVRTRLPPP